MLTATDFDKLVGQIAGAIYTDLNAKFPQPPLMLIQPLTFKVRKILEEVTDLSLLSEDQRTKLAQDIRISIVPILFTYEIDPTIIEQSVPMIEASAFKALSQTFV